MTMIKKFTLEIKAHLHNQKGSALMSVIMVFLVMLILLGSGSVLALNNFRSSQTDKENHSAYYLAEAGINEFIDSMTLILTQEQNKTHSSQSLVDKINASITFDNLEIMGQTALRTVKIESNGEDLYTIRSQASLNNESRVLEMQVEKLLSSLNKDDKSNWGFVDDYGLILKDPKKSDWPKINGNTYPKRNKNIQRFNQEQFPVDETILNLDKTPTMEGLKDFGVRLTNKNLKDQYLDKPGQVHKNFISNNKFELEKGDIAVLNFSDSNETEFWLDELTVSKYDNFGKKDEKPTILYIDVGDKDITLYVKDKVKVEGSLIVLADKGTLTIHSDKADLEPVYFTAVQGPILEETSHYQMKNSLIMISDKKMQVELEDDYIKNRMFNATLITSGKLDLEVELSGNETNKNNIVINVIALGDSEIEIECESGVCQDSLPMFVYMPKGELELEGVNLEGFFYVDKIEDDEDDDDDDPQSTITHKKDIREQIPKIIRDLFEMDGKNQGTGSGPGDSSSKEIEFKAIREVSP